MRFGLIQEGVTPIGTTHHRRYKELIREVQVAEDAGFDFWGTSEQHFIGDQASVSAPEVLFGAVAAVTSKINIRHMIVLLPFNFNHPVRVAERIATLDIVSDGRAQLGIGRANTFLELEGFGVDPRNARPEMLEALEVIAKALTQETFSHDGELIKVPPRQLVPRAVQYPHPPIFAAATSMEMTRICGDKGIGAMFSDTFLGWEYLQEGIENYRKAQTQSHPVTGHMNDSLGVASFSAFCAETDAEAREIGGDDAFRFLRAVSHVYGQLADKSEDYAYMRRVKELKKFGGDLDFLKSTTSTVLLGTPDDFIERVKKLEQMGVQEVIWRIEGGGHENICKSLQLIGKYVIPEFKNPASIVRARGPFEGGIP